MSAIMKNTKKIFRTLIILNIVLAIFGSTIDFIFPELVPASLKNEYNNIFEKEDFSLLFSAFIGLISFIIIIAGMIATIGLYLLKKWSRSLAVFVSLLVVIIYPALGPNLQSGWSLMFLETSMMLWGAVLSMTFFSDLKIQFEND